MTLNIANIQFSKGEKLFLTLSDRRCLEGTYSRSSNARNSIIVHNVSFVPSDGKEFEQLELKLNDIEKIKSLSDNNFNHDRSQSEASGDSNPSDQTSTLSSSDDKPFKETSLYTKLKDVVDKYIFIDQFDENFLTAMRTLEKAYTIAVVGEGSSCGRLRHLTVLGIATMNMVFLFDIVNLGLGSNAFKAHGSFLKRILESKRVLKVVYNCGLLADCLQYKHEVKLQNVFDAQACHVVVLMNQGLKPSSVSFSDLISEYLQLPGDIGTVEAPDPKLWRQRPLEEILKKSVAWRVSLLRKLKAPLDDALYAPFDKLCQKYLNSVRDIDDEVDVRILLGRYDDGKIPSCVMIDQ